MNIPYTVTERPDTGLTNGKLGIWLFLASEVMLFGALFSTYVILITSSVTMVMAWATLKLNDFAKHRLYLIATFLLAGVFLVNKYFEYKDHFDKGETPAHSTFTAIYFTLTGLHGLHIIGGMVVMLYLLGPGAKLWKNNSDQF